MLKFLTPDPHPSPQLKPSNHPALVQPDQAKQLREISMKTEISKCQLSLTFNTSATKFTQSFRISNNAGPSSYLILQQIPTIKTNIKAFLFFSIPLMGRLAFSFFIPLKHCKNLARLWFGEPQLLTYYGTLQWNNVIKVESCLASLEDNQHWRYHWLVSLSTSWNLQTCKHEKT